MVELLNINKIKEGYTSENFKRNYGMDNSCSSFYCYLSAYKHISYRAFYCKTFADNDKVFVNKFSKNYERGDEVVFHANETDDYIKRIIGVPGDTIEYRNDVLYVNGQKVEEPYLAQKIKEAKASGTAPFTPDFNIEFLSSTKSKTVPEGTYFVLGDNRQHSTDSRVFGFVKKEAMIGKVSLRYYPFSSFKFF